MVNVGLLRALALFDSINDFSRCVFVIKTDTITGEYLLAVCLHGYGTFGSPLNCKLLFVKSQLRSQSYSNICGLVCITSASSDNNFNPNFGFHFLNVFKFLNVFDFELESVSHFAQFCSFDGKNKAFFTFTRYWSKFYWNFSFFTFGDFYYVLFDDHVIWVT